MENTDRLDFVDCLSKRILVLNWHKHTDYGSLERLRQLQEKLIERR
jgi:hypothetical protein